MKHKLLKIYYFGLICFGPGKTKCRQFAICNLQFCKGPDLTPPYKAGRVVKLTCQYNPDFQGLRISHATLESIHLNKPINCKERIKIFTIGYFFFNIWYYPMSKISLSTLEMLSLHYILHASCPVLVLWMILQISTKKTILRPFHSSFISLILMSRYITSICMGPWCWWSMVARSQVRMGPHILLLPKIISTTKC